MGYIPNKQLSYAILSNVMDYVVPEIRELIDPDDPQNKLDIKFFLEHVFNTIIS
jgi:hypothetical protein